LLAPAAAQELPVILEVQVENQVNYGDDSPGPSQVGRTPGPVPLNAATMAINHTAFAMVADVTTIKINGSPVKGVLSGRGYNVRINPTPPPGFAIGDVVRGAFWQWGLEFLKPDGGAIGSLFFRDGAHSGSVVFALPARKPESKPHARGVAATIASERIVDRYPGAPSECGSREHVWFCWRWGRPGVNPCRAWTAA
jgi:hypothetical protein